MPSLEAGVEWIKADPSRRSVVFRQTGVIGGGCKMWRPRLLSFSLDSTYSAVGRVVVRPHDAFGNVQVFNEATEVARMATTANDEWELRPRRVEALGYFFDGIFIPPFPNYPKKDTFDLRVAFVPPIDHLVVNFDSFVVPSHLHGEGHPLIYFETNIPDP